MNIMKIFEEVYETRARLTKEFNDLSMGSTTTKRILSYDDQMECALERVDEICAGTSHDPKTARSVYNLYVVMRDRGNERLDFEGMDKTLAGSFVEFMRENGIREFTCSAENAGPEIAMWFKNAGCRLAGVMDICGKDGKVPALLFETN